MTNYFREQIDRKKREIELQKQESNIYTIHPLKSELILLYEVVDKQGRGLWGGEDSLEAIKWLRLNLRDDARLLVSAWDSDEEDAHLVGQSIDITRIILEAFKEGLGV